MSLDIESTRVATAGNGEAVVFLHCLGSDLDYWTQAADILSNRYTTIRYDFPGHGMSPVPNHEYSLQDLGDQCVALMHSRGIAKAHLVGVSMGGMVALDVATRCPALVATLVVADAAAKYSPKMAEILTLRTSRARSGGMAAIVEETLNAWFTAQAMAGNGAAVSYARRTLGNTPVAGYALAVQALCRANLLPALPSIRCPTLVACGADDIAFVQSSAELAGLLHEAQMQWLPGAKHAATLEHASAFAADLAAFFWQRATLLCETDATGKNQ